MRAESCAALPFMSAPLEAAVGEVLGTLLVSVAVMRNRAAAPAAHASSPSAKETAQAAPAGKEKH